MERLLRQYRAEAERASAPPLEQRPMAELFRRHGRLLDVQTPASEVYDVLAVAILALEDPVAVIKQAAARPQPLRCPVCEGRGRVPAGLYDVPETGTVPCEACSGTGILWR